MQKSEIIEKLKDIFWLAMPLSLSSFTLTFASSTIYLEVKKTLDQGGGYQWFFLLMLAVVGLQFLIISSAYCYGIMIEKKTVENR